MPRSRPQLSITLPRNFTFHYTEGEEPTTPDQEAAVPPPQAPRVEGPYRIKRRARPTISTLLPEQERESLPSSDIPIPSIEQPLPAPPYRPLYQQRVSDPVTAYLTPTTSRGASSLPHTPEPTALGHKGSWKDHEQLGASIIRPLSTCSLLSDSSDDSRSSISSFPACDGSCTSPESDAPNPFRFASIKRRKGRQLATLARLDPDMNQAPSTPKSAKPKWTPDMDRHLWTAYLAYLQDPTVTPFKMLPGVAPPLGVCHRVARQARRTWRGGRASSRSSSNLLAPPLLSTNRSLGKSPTDPRGSPDTIRATRSGSDTPTETAHPRYVGWPKSGSSTRQRLRLLCKRKPSIAPHYQRLLHSRSPSPLSSGPCSVSCSRSRLSQVSSPPSLPHSTSFNTRDVQISLTTSTADTMQPDGPLAQLTQSEDSTSSPSVPLWSEGPAAPFASDIPIPSDLTISEDSAMTTANSAVTEPFLGSPFGFHTWGPSRSKQRSRPAAVRLLSSDDANFDASASDPAVAAGPALRSPLRLHNTMPYPGMHKRRALHQLEDESTPGGAALEMPSIGTLLSSPIAARHRRVRSRGFSLGNMTSQGYLESLFTPPEDEAASSPQTSTTQNRPSLLQPFALGDPIRRLDSPFHHTVSQVPRRSPRHTATMSLGAPIPTTFSSISETLGQSRPLENAACLQPETATLTPMTTPHA